MSVEAIIEYAGGVEPYPEASALELTLLSGQSTEIPAQREEAGTDEPVLYVMAGRKPQIGAEAATAIMERGRLIGRITACERLLETVRDAEADGMPVVSWQRPMLEIALDGLRSELTELTVPEQVDTGSASESEPESADEDELEDMYSRFEKYMSHDEELALVGAAQRGERTRQYLNSGYLADTPEIRRVIFEGRRAVEALSASLAPFIAYMARNRRFSYAQIPRHDLEQQGYVGLMKSIYRFDASRGFRLISFAGANIIGEMQRYVRDHGTLIRTNRLAYDNYPKYRDARNTLLQKFGREPTIDEIALYSGIDAGIIDKIVNRPRTVELSINGEVDLEGQQNGMNSRKTWSVAVGMEPEQERWGDIDSMHALLGLLPSRERKIIELLYFNEESGGERLTQTEVGMQMGISQMHVSRLHESTLNALRDCALADAPTVAFCQGRLDYHRKRVGKKHERRSA